MATPTLPATTVGTDQLGIAGEPLYDQHSQQIGVAVMAYVTAEGDHLPHTLIDLVYKDNDGYREILTDVPIYMIGTLTVGGPAGWSFATQCCSACTGRAISFSGWVSDGHWGSKRVPGSELVGNYPLVWDAA